MWTMKQTLNPKKSNTLSQKSHHRETSQQNFEFIYFEPIYFTRFYLSAIHNKETRF